MWVMLAGLLDKNYISNEDISFIDQNNLQVVIYNGDQTVTKAQIIQNVQVFSRLFPHLSILFLISDAVIEKV